MELKTPAHFAPESTAHISPKWGALLDRNIYQKQVLYVLSYPSSYIGQFISEGSRWDQPFIDFLKSNNLPFIDLAQAHFEDYKAFKLNVKEYLGKYFIGHYNPSGNFFCAHTLRDKVVEMLDPRPLPYKV